MGNEVSVVTSRFPEYDTIEANVIRLPTLAVIKGDWGFIPICPTIISLLREKQCDVIHMHTPPRAFAEFALVARLLTRKRNPFVLTYHAYNDALVSLANAVYHVHDRTAMRWLLRKMDRIIVSTEAYRDLVNNAYKIGHEKIVVVRPGVDHEIFNPSRYPKEQIRETYGIPNEKNVILYVGRLIALKGIDYLLRALSLVRNEVNDVLLLVVGDDTLGYERYLEELCRKLSLDSCVRFLGGVSHEAIIRLLSLADVLVLPSLSEGFGLVLIEAMSMEKPIVATRVGGIPHTIEDGRTGILVQKGNVLELANALILLLSDKKSASDMGRLGRSVVREKYSLDTFVRKVLDIYDEVLAMVPSRM